MSFLLTKTQKLVISNYHYWLLAIITSSRIGKSNCDSNFFVCSFFHQKYANFGSNVMQMKYMA